LLDFGITNFNNREIARHNHMVSKYFSNIITLKLLLGLVYGVIGIIVALTARYSFYQVTLILFLMLNQFLMSFILYLRSNINALLMFITDSLLSVLDKALMILFLSFLLWSSFFNKKFEIEWFIYTQTISYIITAIVALIIVINKCQYFLPKIDFRYLRIIIKKSLPFSILVLLMSLYNRFEPILLERLLPDGKTHAGIYAQGYRILEVLSNFAYLFPVLLLPLFSKMLKNKENVSQLVNLAFSLLIVPAIIISSACSVYSYDIMNLLYHKTTSGGVFGVLIMGICGISITYLYGTLLTANGNLKQLNIMAISTVVFNITLNLIIIPIYKSQGAAWSSLITQTLSAIVQLIMAYKLLNLKTENKRTFSFAIWAICFIAILIFVKLFIHQWFEGFSVIIACGLIMAIVLKLLRVKEITSALFLVGKK